MLDPLTDLMKALVEVLLVLARRMPEDRIFPAFAVLTVAFTLIAFDLITAFTGRLHARRRKTDNDSDTTATPQDSHHDNSQDQEGASHEHSENHDPVIHAPHPVPSKPGATK
ncbi:hypothetical protein [Bifidobacterium callimiconis]|uniref:Uncharacterized protein n=1 Tax=Bifidobacterium callimiconis TaxID=2306973 RepID=A0A430F6V1_9BIFI|nr:hypothetical protein [Bifidobacterium callimiconis]RSX47120.1 hypothetical protein D2E23_2255 [Bifidobacterium callimiconis]